MTLEASLRPAPHLKRTLRRARRIAGGARAMARSERGIAVPTTLWVMVISMGIAMAASTSAIVSQRGTVKDNATKRALEIADSGVQQALYRGNKVTNGLSTSPYCLVDSGGTLTAQTASAGAWCPAQTGNVGGGSYSYQVKAPYLTTNAQGQELTNVDVVSTGTYNAVTRRVKVHAKSLSMANQSYFGGFAVSSLSDLTMGGNSSINGDSSHDNRGGGGASNHSVSLSGGATICGDIQHGPSGTYSQNGSGGQCPGYHLLTGSLTLPPVDQGTVATNNDNGRFFTLDPKGGSPSWSASTRTLSLGNKDSVTLGGSNYSFCSLSVGNGGKLYIAAGAHVKIFFDTPEACGQSSGVTQLDVKGDIINTGGNPADAQFLMVGSSTRTTNVSLTANSGTEDIVIYAPNTNISFHGQATLNGAIAGKSVDIQSGHVTYDTNVDDLGTITRVIPLYTRDSYLECQGTAPGGGPPDANC